MAQTQFERCEAWFRDHVARYRSEAGPDAIMVDRKERHTYRVLDNTREIARESGARPELIEAMDMAALLHDVARFPQVVGHATYDDGASFNHAEAGARLIEESDLLATVDPHLRTVILSAIHHHNVAVLPNVLHPDTRLVLEVLRDADKADALRNNLKYLKPDQPYGKALKAGLTWDDEAITPAVADLAMQRQLIPFDVITLSNDYILFLCCWMYDLHFHASFALFKKNKYFEGLVNKLPDTETGMELKRQLLEDLDWLIKRSRKA